ncbi:hypothetical protein DL95DRAFT_418032 [Leptodontidium sp. 2 PMI_412]|nr:hypothetical protein DL95DRAFT_418032 [Leptodontidium sp. 2 PMI_412]
MTFDSNRDCFDLIMERSTDRKLFSANPRSVRVAVTSEKDNGADKCFIAIYNRPAFGDQQLDFEREDDEPKEMKKWEAALATASAPFYFCRFEKRETEINYVDAALHSNFPVQYALDQMNMIWASPGEGLTKKPSLDNLLSVGTGQQTREVVIPVPLGIGGFKTICTTFFNNLDSDRQWLEFERNHVTTWVVVNSAAKFIGPTPALRGIRYPWMTTPPWIK